MKIDEYYDISNEGAPIDYCNDSSIIDKYFVYRAGGKMHKINEIKDLNRKKELEEKRRNLLKKYGFVEKSRGKDTFISPVIIDPDSESKILQDIYKKLWKENLPKCVYDKNIIKGETLNSVNTTLNQYYRFKTNEKSVNNLYILIKYLEEKDTIKKIFDNDYLKKFLNIYHSIGNFMPIPKGCNGPRGTGLLKDYWDLTLLCIYKYYINQDNIAIEAIVGNDKVKIYKEWLDFFGKGKNGWKNFIEKNYLKVYVDNNYYPIELWKNHFKNNVMPQTEKECIEYFKNSYNCIKERGKNLIKELNKS